MDTNKVTRPVQSDTSGDEHPDQKLADELAAGLRALADMLQATPELAQDLRVRMKWQSMHVFDGPERVFPVFIRAAKAHGATVTKDYDESYAKVSAKWSDNFGLALQTDREQVCERVVVGTETVTKTVKDPEALAAVPEVEVTEEVEIVDWVCTPLLKVADAEAVSS